MLGALAAVNGSKLTWGAAAIVASLGSRFVIGDLTAAQQTVLRHPLFKRAALFCMMFLPTRDILLAVCLTVVVSVLLEHVMNEQSAWCMLPESIKSPPMTPQQEQRKAQIAQATPSEPLPIAMHAPLMGPSAVLRQRKRQKRKTAPGPARQQGELEHFSPPIGSAMGDGNVRSWY